MALTAKLVSLVTGLSFSLGGVVAGVCSSGSNTEISQVGSPVVEAQTTSTLLNQSSESTKNLSDTDNSSVEDTKGTEEISTAENNVQQTELLEEDLLKKLEEEEHDK